AAGGEPGTLAPARVPRSLAGAGRAAAERAPRALVAGRGSDRAVLKARVRGRSAVSAALRVHLRALKQELEQLLLASLGKLTGSVLAQMPAPSAVVVERTRDNRHGEFATNLALRLAKSAGRNPRELAADIVAALPASPLLSRAEVAGAGFINFHLTAEAYAHELARIHALGGAYGESRLGQGERVLVEFVSANPTGPLHVGHGRQAAYGAT